MTLFSLSVSKFGLMEDQDKVVKVKELKNHPVDAICKVVEIKDEEDLVHLTKDGTCVEVDGFSFCVKGLDKDLVFEKAKSVLKVFEKDFEKMKGLFKD